MRESVFLYEKHIHSMFFLFIRTGGQLSDREVLKALDLEDYLPVAPSGIISEPHVFLTNDREWLHVADDLCYSLWHKGHEEVCERLASRLADFEIFSFWTGDVDWAFGFSHFFRTRLLRCLEVADPHMDVSRRTIQVDTGNPFPAELPLDEVKEPLSYLPQLAATLGIDMAHNSDTIRCYKSPIGRRRISGLTNAISNF